MSTLYRCSQVQCLCMTKPRAIRYQHPQEAIPLMSWLPFRSFDTNVMMVGHYDPRVAVKLATVDDANYENIGDINSIKRRMYYGGSFTSTSGPIGSAPSFYGRNAVSSTTLDGSGRWLYRDDAPYVLMTAAEMKFCLAEAYWKLNMKAEALQAYKDGVALDMDFTSSYISPGSVGKAEGGDKITKSVFTAAADEYLAGPYVDGLDIADFTLSHIMMQENIHQAGTVGMCLRLTRNGIPMQQRYIRVFTLLRHRLRAEKRPTTHIMKVHPATV